MTVFWNNRYSVEEYAYGEEPNIYFKQKLDLLKPGKLLLPAEGEGRNAVYAASQGWDVTAVDSSSAGELKALSLVAKKSVDLKYIVSPLEEFTFPQDTFDAAALIFTHFNSKIRSRIHNAVFKSLKKGGHLIIEVFSKGQILNSSGGPKDADMLCTLDDFRIDFAYLDIIELNEITTILNEGKFHKGEARVIRLFGINNDD